MADDGSMDKVRKLAESASEDGDVVVAAVLILAVQNFATDDTAYGYVPMTPSPPHVMRGLAHEFLHLLDTQRAAEDRQDGV